MRLLLASLSKLSKLLEALFGKKEFLKRLAVISNNPTQTYREVVAADPTPTKKYAAWILFMLEHWEIANPDEVSELLKKFEKALPRLKGSQKDLYNYSTPVDVEVAIKNATSNASYKKASDLGKGAELVASSHGYDIYAIDSVHACVRAARGTQWCIADSSTAEEYFENDAQLYLVFKDGKKYGMLVTEEWGDEKIHASIFDLRDQRVIIKDPGFLDALSFLDNAGQLLGPITDRKIIPKSWLDIVANDADMAYNYALVVINGPFPEGEHAIASDSGIAFDYARNVLGYAEGDASKWRRSWFDSHGNLKDMPY